MKILAIESSCDDTAAAVVDGGRVLSSIVSSQLIHEAYGGVVPELASREHQKLIVPVVEEALERASCKKEQLDAIGVTSGPGLAGSLLVGLSFAKGLANGLDIPLVGVNHLEGHICSVFTDQTYPTFPLLCLIVSGGHTELVLVNDWFDYSVMGRTRDDAAGEAFDKFAKLLGLGFPGGPIVGKLAEDGDSNFHRFPRARLDGFDFSFSGVKTSVLYYLNKIGDKDRSDFISANKEDLCASFQEAVVDMLIHQLERGIAATNPQSVAIVGGVSANRRLTERATELCSSRDVTLSTPLPQYATDNAGMIGIAAYLRARRSLFDPLSLTINPSARLPSNTANWQ